MKDDQSANIANSSSDQVLSSDKLLFAEHDNVSFLSSPSKMQNLLHEFKKLYSDKLQRVEEMGIGKEEYLQKKVNVLEAWVEDLGEQNGALVSTVEDLEREASQRVELLQERLDKMASVTKASCVSLRDHQMEINTIISEKLELETDAQKFRDKILTLEKTNADLLKENENFHEIFSKNKYNFYENCLEETGTDGFGEANRFSCRERSLVNKGEMTLGNFDDSCRRTSVYEDKDRDILQRDRHIADLQAELTTVHERLSHTQADLDEATDALNNWRAMERQESLEISHRNELARSLLSTNRLLRDNQLPSIDHDSISKDDIELRLSDNIDALAIRLADLEEEGNEIRNQYASLKSEHEICHSTIQSLQEQLNTSHQSVEEMRTVFRTERCESGEVLVTLRKQFEELKMEYQEASIQLEMKSETIRELRKQLQAEPQEKLQVQKRNISTETIGVDFCDSEDFLKISKLENEIAEKNILLRDLQSHLASSRQEINIKDETIMKVEDKLDNTRRSMHEKENRLEQLMGQLTVLQLEVARLHGLSQQIKQQLKSKSDLVQKLEIENTSLSTLLNERSSKIEMKIKDSSETQSDMEQLKKEISDQKVTIVSLQEALIASKQTCDHLRLQLDSDDHFERKKIHLDQLCEHLAIQMERNQEAEKIETVECGPLEIREASFQIATYNNPAQLEREETTVHFESEDSSSYKDLKTEDKIDTLTENCSVLNNKDRTMCCDHASKGERSIQLSAVDANKEIDPLSSYLISQLIDSYNGQIQQLWTALFNCMNVVQSLQEDSVKKLDWNIIKDELRNLFNDIRKTVLSSTETGKVQEIPSDFAHDISSINKQDFPIVKEEKCTLGNVLMKLMLEELSNVGKDPTEGLSYLNEQLHEFLKHWQDKLLFITKDLQKIRDGLNFTDKETSSHTILQEDYKSLENLVFKKLRKVRSTSSQTLEKPEEVAKPLLSSIDECSCCKLDKRKILPCHSKQYSTRREQKEIVEEHCSGKFLPLNNTNYRDSPFNHFNERKELHNAAEKIDRESSLAREIIAQLAQLKEKILGNSLEMSCDNRTKKRLMDALYCSKEELDHYQNTGCPPAKELTSHCRCSFTSK